MELIQICKCCNLSKTSDFFFLKDDECYRCIYKAKLADPTKPKREKYCKICNATLLERWAYCSDECANVAKKNYVNWTRRIPYCTKDWKKRFNF